jgi:hypothetical protein
MVAHPYEILEWIRIRGSIPLTNGYGTYPDPAISSTGDLQDVNKTFLLITLIS